MSAAVRRQRRWGTRWGTPTGSPAPMVLSFVLEEVVALHARDPQFTAGTAGGRSSLPAGPCPAEESGASRPRDAGRGPSARRTTSRPRPPHRPAGTGSAGWCTAVRTQIRKAIVTVTPLKKITFRANDRGACGVGLAFTGGRLGKRSTRGAVAGCLRGTSSLRPARAQAPIPHVSCMGVDVKA